MIHSNEESGKSKYAQKVKMRRNWAKKIGERGYYNTICEGKPKKLPLPIPCWEDAGDE